MEKTSDDSRNEQLELFGSEDSTAKPRPKDIPASKNTEASASMFGWEFQIVVGVILSIVHIRELSSVEIEGSTEDVELYFEQDNPEYVQVKAVQHNYIEAKDTDKATLAMNTLINTSNLTNGKYSKLVYAANFRNPLGMSEARLKAAWDPDMHTVFTRAYNELPSTAQRYIDQRIVAAQKQLAENYDSSTKYFDRNRLYVTTILFGPAESSQGLSEKRPTIQVLKGVLEQLLQEAGVTPRSMTIKHLSDALKSFYMDNAASSSKDKGHLKITKERLAWRIILELISDENMMLNDDVPFAISEEVNNYTRDFLEDQSQDIGVINKVYAELASIIPNRLPTKTEVESFIEDKWTDFKEDFPIDKDDVVREYGTKQLLTMILEGQNSVRQMKKAVNLL